jgi:hypothetical protein
MRGPKNLYDFLDKAWRHLAGGVSDSRSPERYTAVAKVAANGTPRGADSRAARSGPI